ncbi:MAG: hypothetical protein V3R64_01140 [Sphingomonadales bacterium]
MKYKKIILYTAIGATLASWIGLGVGLAIGVEKTIFIILVTVAAVVTEILFWAVAVVFGISVFESRKKIWKWIKTKLRLGKNKNEVV